MTAPVESSYEIVDATLADVPVITDIFNHSIAHFDANWDYEPNSIETRQGWYKSTIAQDCPVLVARDKADGQVICVGSYAPFRAKAGYFWTVENSVYVADGHKGKGVGRAMLKALLQDAKRRGKHSMVAAIGANQAVSLKLHASEGFVEVGRIKEAGFKFEKWLELVYMQVML